MILIDNASFIGRKLNNNVYSKQGGLLLPKNSVLSDHNLDLLHQHGVQLLDEDTRLVTEGIIDETISEVQFIYEKIHYSAEKPSNQTIQQKVMPKILELSANYHFSDVILGLRKKDDYTYRHCIGVSVLSYLIGKWLGLAEKELNDLAVAGLLHDVGKTKISDAILQKAGKLSPKEYAEMQLHTVFGYEMILELPNMADQQALVALQHHEREDGSGYPYGKSGDEIEYFSKIVAVADVFHSMISERVYKKAIPLFQALQEIYRRAFGLFDPAIVQCFITNLMNRLIGDSVLLADGKAARIVMLNPDDPINPLVESQGKYYDLRRSDNKIMDFVKSQK